MRKWMAEAEFANIDDVSDFRPQPRVRGLSEIFLSGHVTAHAN